MTTPKRPRRVWPPLPTAFPALGGAVKVEVVKELHVEGTHCHGSWDEETRIIHIDSATRGSFRWKTFWHELMHVCLGDTGLAETLTEPGNEAVCNGFATFMTALMSVLEIRFKPFKATDDG